MASVGSSLPFIFQNYAGVLSKSGTAQAQLNLPNIPALMGVRLHNAFITLKASAPSGVASISPTAFFTITT